MITYCSSVVRIDVVVCSKSINQAWKEVCSCIKITGKTGYLNILLWLYSTTCFFLLHANLKNVSGMQWLSVKIWFHFPFFFFRYFQAVTCMWFLAFNYTCSSLVSCKDINGHFRKSMLWFLFFDVRCVLWDSYFEFLQRDYGNHLESFNNIYFQWQHSIASSWNSPHIHGI